MRRRTVLITGAAGLIGEVLRHGLSPDYDVIGVDRRRADDVRRVDLRRPRAVRRALDGVDTVVDLAAVPAAPGTWEDVFENNMPATATVLEAARISGVRRVVFASSNHVVGLYERDEPYASIVAGRYDGLVPSRLRRLTAADPIRPDGPYAVGKAFGEAAARYYSEEFGVSALCLRIGTVNREDRPRTPRHFATLLTHDDLIRLTRSCIEAPAGVGFGLFYGVSANTWRFWDIEEAREAIGYEPRDDAEQFRAQTG